MIKTNQILSYLKYKGIFLFAIISLILIFASCGRDENKALVIGDIVFGSSIQDALEVAETHDYKIESKIDCVLSLSDNVKALGIVWDRASIMSDSVNGIKQIILTRKNSATTPEIKTTLFNEIRSLFPNSEHTLYLKSVIYADSLPGHYSSSQSDYATIFELKDKDDEYGGSSYYILSRDEFTTIIYKKHTLD